MFNSIRTSQDVSFLELLLRFAIPHLPGTWNSDLEGSTHLSYAMEMASVACLNAA